MQSNPSANASASRARIGVGPAEPMHVPTRPSDTSSANEHTAITIALRVPTFANCCAAPARTGIHTRRDQLVVGQHVALAARR